MERVKEKKKTGNSKRKRKRKSCVGIGRGSLELAVDEGVTKMDRI